MFFIVYSDDIVKHIDRTFEIFTVKLRRNKFKHRFAKCLINIFSSEFGTQERGDYTPEVALYPVMGSPAGICLKVTLNLLPAI